VNKCKSNSGISGSHCAGPYEHGSTMMGGHGFGSVYITPTTPSTATAAATATTTPEHGWTKWKGTAVPGTACHSACQTGTPPTTDPMGYIVTSWCNTTDNLWGECGGCAPGKYKPTGSNVCSGVCSSDQESLDDGPHTDCGTCMDGMVTGFSGSNSRSCTSCTCKLNTSHPVQMRHNTEPVFTCQSHTHTDASLATRCFPARFGSASGGSYQCTKSGRRKFARTHKDFYNQQSSEGYHNWWAVECGLEKIVRCEAISGTSTTKCYVKKQAQCIKTCKGTTIWSNGNQKPTHVTNALASTVAGNCFPVCVNNSRSDKKIKAVPGFLAVASSLSRSEGPLEDQFDWCKEEAIGL
jgi:hypothetical protein